MIAISILLALQASTALDGAMQYQEQVDPITDKKVVMAIGGTANMQVAVACAPASHSIRVAFTTDAYIPKTGLLTASHPFTYRFDGDKPVTADWYYDTGVVQQFESGTTIPFIRRLLTGSKLAVRGSSIFGSDAVEAVFPISGERGPVSRVIKACGATKVSKALGDLLD
jgi:hypothetical protein